jgi:hypothetical protein
MCQRQKSEDLIDNIRIIGIGEIWKAIDNNTKML